MNIYDSKLLIIDDEVALQHMVRDLLMDEGYIRIDTAASCTEALEKIENNAYHLILMDVMLPDGNGFELFQRLSRRELIENVPVIFLSARDEDSARLKGLGLGADDYITKPFLPEELLLRVKAVLRRTYKFTESSQVLALGDIQVSLDSGEVTGPDNTTTLTAKEHAILQKLYDNKGKIVTIDSLCQTVWPDGSFGLESSLIVHIRHLREKIEEDPSGPKHLLTVRGLGYKLVL